MPKGQASDETCSLDFSVGIDNIMALCQWDVMCRYERTVLKKMYIDVPHVNIYLSPLFYRQLGCRELPKMVSINITYL